MTADNNLSNILVAPNAAVFGYSPQSSKLKNPFKGYDALFISYLLILQSVQISSQTTQIQSKDLQNNAAVQNQMIGMENQLNYEQISHGMIKTTVTVARWTFGSKGMTITKSHVEITEKVNSTLLQRMAEKNEEVSAIRNVIEDQLNLVRQGGQIASSNINSTVDNAQQAVQEDSSILKILNNLTNQISKI